MDRRSSWNAHLALNEEITGSSPVRSTRSCGPGEAGAHVGLPIRRRGFDPRGPLRSEVLCWPGTLTLDQGYAGSIPALGASCRGSPTGEAPASKPGQCGFDSRSRHHAFARRVGPRPGTTGAAGSSPAEGSHAVVAQQVARHLAMVKLAGSNPASRSNHRPRQRKGGSGGNRVGHQRRPRPAPPGQSPPRGADADPPASPRSTRAQPDRLIGVYPMPTAVRLVR
jgi:hypothetical protein